jgi:hypothetical protein
LFEDSSSTWITAAPASNFVVLTGTIYDPYAGRRTDPQHVVDRAFNVVSDRRQIRVRQPILRPQNHQELENQANELPDLSRPITKCGILDTALSELTLENPHRWNSEPDVESKDDSFVAFDAAFSDE